MGWEWLRFNVSHAGRLALIAVARCEVGVDVEPVVPSRRTSEICGRLLLGPRKGRVVPLSGPERLAAFYACWTRKEAVVKAIGGGMSVPLDSFDVLPQPSLPPTCRSLDTT